MKATRSLLPQESAAINRAFALLRAGKPGMALEVARDLASRAADAPDAQHVLALCLAENGNVDDSLAAFERALSLAPDQPMILSNYATALRRCGRAHDALAPARRIARGSPRSIQAWLELANTALLANDAEQARDAAARALQLESASTPALQALGRAARAQEDLETAQHAFALIVDHDSTHLQGWLGLGDSQRRAGRADLALKTYRRAAANGAGAVELSDATTGALLEAGRLKDAFAQARRVTHEHPGFAGGWTALANLAWEYDHREAAREEFARFARAVADQPSNGPLRLAYVRVLLATGLGEDALLHARALRSLANDPMLALLEAQALALLGRDDEANALHAALHAGVGRHDPRALNAYARHALRLGRPDLAAELAGAATRMQPHSQEAWAYLSVAWRMMGDSREHWLCDYETMIGVVQVQPPDDFVDLPAFLQAVAVELEPLHAARHEPMQQSLRGGSQTAGRLFGRDSKVLTQARTMLMDAVEGWIGTLARDDGHPFLSRMRHRVRLGGSWSVKLWSEGRHANHMHSEGWMSSAFYVSLPPSITDMGSMEPPAGAIQFGQPPPELASNLPPRRIVRPREGRLVLFPSYMWHGTIPFHDELPRITIAFDMLPCTKPQ